MKWGGFSCLRMDLLAHTCVCVYVSHTSMGQQECVTTCCQCVSGSTSSVRQLKINEIAKFANFSDSTGEVTFDLFEGGKDDEYTGVSFVEISVTQDDFFYGAAQFDGAYLCCHSTIPVSIVPTGIIFFMSMASHFHTVDVSPNSSL